MIRKFVAIALLFTAAAAYAAEESKSVLDYLKARLPATLPPAATDKLPIMQGNALRMILLPDLRPAFKNMTTGWQQVTNKPSTFPPSAHTQGIGTIDGLQDALDGKEPAIGTKGTAFNKSFGSSAGTVTEGNDPRLSDSRTPLAHEQAASTVTYGETTVAAALDQLLYVPISISSFTLSGSASNVTQEIGSSYAIQSPGLAWSTNNAATMQTINGTPRTSPYMPNSPVSSNQSWTLLVGDGTTIASSTRTVTFTHKRYWGVSSATAIDDAGIIALSSEFSTSRAQTRTLTASAQYLYIVYVDTAGAASFTVNGFSDTSWQLTQRSFVNASGYSTTFRIYRSANPLTGTYTVVVS